MNRLSLMMIYALDDIASFLTVLTRIKVYNMSSGSN